MSYYTFLSLFSFSGFKELKIVQNQIFISDIIKDFILIKNYNDLTNYISDDLRFFLARNRGDKVKPCTEWSKMLNAANLKVNIIPLEISISERFFRYIADICESSKNHTIQDNQLFITTTSLATLINNSNDWWGLKTELFRFINNVYLQPDIEEADWDIITQIAINSIDLIVDYSKIISKYNKSAEPDEKFVDLEEKENYILFIDNNYKYPVTDFVSPNHINFEQFNSKKYEDSVRSCLKFGYIPFLKKFIDIMPNTGARHEREILTRIIKEFETKIQRWQN